MVKLRETYGDARMTSRLPFASVTHFHEDSVVQIERAACLKDIELACDPHRVSANLFYALRVDGVVFVHGPCTRRASGSCKGISTSRRCKNATGVPLHDNVEGTLVCLWSPRYASSFSVPGYHFHFISKDRTKGGHVLDCSAQHLRARIQIVSEYDIRLPEAGSFLTANLNRDPASDLAKAE